jgi:hypothetical protein
MAAFNILSNNLIRRSGLIDISFYAKAGLIFILIFAYILFKAKVDF